MNRFSFYGKRRILSGRSGAGLVTSLLWLSGALLVPAGIADAQIVDGMTNLIVNGDAEAGSAGTSSSDVVLIPDWTRTGNATVLPYGLTGYVQTGDPAPTNRQFQYFVGAASGSSTLVQNIDVSSAASAINGGNVKYTVSAYLGAYTQGQAVPVSLTVDFKNAAGQIFNTAPIGPNAGYPGDGMSLQQQIGLVPVGTTAVTVTLTLQNRFATADSLSLVFSTLGSSPSSVVGAELIVNGDAEAGASGTPNKSPAPQVPGWSTTGSSVCPYGGSGWIQTTDPGPSSRGTNMFCGYFGSSSSYQDVDVSAAASLIDGGKLNYQLGAWLGSLSGQVSPTLTYVFYDWSGKQLAPTAQLGPASHSGNALVPVSHSDLIPAGTRRVRISLTFPAYFDVADNITFSIGSAAAPIVTEGGVVPVYSSVTTVESGSWISIYGTGLAASTTSWNGDFPTKLGNTSVTIDSNPAYLWFVSPTQINAQVPDDAATGTVPVVVTTDAGSFTTSVTLAAYAPSFSLFNSKYPAAVVPTPNSAGNSGNGYDYIGPANGFSFPSRPVKAGETILLYGVGFGPTSPVVSAGVIYSGAAPCVTLPTVTIGNVQAEVQFAGIIEAGLYQLNVVVPNAGSGDKQLVASVGGVSTPANVVLTLQ